MGNVLAPAPIDDETWAALLRSIYHTLSGYAGVASKGFSRKWRDFRNWISQPHIRKRFIWGSAILIFALIIFGIPALGFSAGGIKAGSWAAGYQGATYAAFTPAGGWFAWLTSIAMTEMVPLVALAGGAISATITWAVTEFLQNKEVPP
ncbi:hypothetical protein BDV93DRAFT_524208 [Ceratobasidium sp. AG-I]|nr:hypothetical protein BDV93DRAFT_524208 [Ceratobasidium sp. AG-I]